MRPVTVIVALIFVAELASAQETAPRPTAGQYQLIAYAAPAERSSLSLNALMARRTFSADTNLYAEAKQSDRMDTGIIEDWRERVFNALGTYVNPRQPDLVNDSRLLSNDELDARASEGRTVARAVLKETVRFTEEQLPAIGRLVKALRFEVSTDMLAREVREEERSGEEENAGSRQVRQPVVKDKLMLRTRLRVPVDGGKFSLVSETSAAYGKVSSFFNVRLDGRYDNSAGLTYALNRDFHLQVERQVARMTGPATGDGTNARASIDLVHLVCKF